MLGWFWLTHGDTLTNVRVTISSGPCAGSGCGTTYYQTTVTPASSTFVTTNGDGFDVYKYDFALPTAPLFLPSAGTYWLSFDEALSTGNNPVYWDQSSGPSLAFDNSTGSIPSESFQIVNVGQVLYDNVNGSTFGVTAWTINTGFQASNNFVYPCGSSSSMFSSSSSSNITSLSSSSSMASSGSSSASAESYCGFGGCCEFPNFKDATPCTLFVSVTGATGGCGCLDGTYEINWNPSIGAWDNAVAGEPTVCGCALYINFSCVGGGSPATGYFITVNWPGNSGSCGVTGYPPLGDSTCMPFFIDFGTNTIFGSCSCGGCQGGGTPAPTVIMQVTG